MAAYVSPEVLLQFRWILLSNRAHLIHLGEVRFREFEQSVQFMLLLSSPEAEEQFNLLKGKYGSLFLWHGSHGNRWDSVLRNGLKNATGTKMQANGAALITRDLFREKFPDVVAVFTAVHKSLSGVKIGECPADHIAV
jgi:hypothetical protein